MSGLRRWFRRSLFTICSVARSKSVVMHSSDCTLDDRCLVLRAQHTSLGVASLLASSTHTTSPLSLPSLSLSLSLLSRSCISHTHITLTPTQHKHATQVQRCSELSASCRLRHERLFDGTCYEIVPRINPALITDRRKFTTKWSSTGF